MTLLNPNAVWWALLAVPIALAYLLRLRTPQRDVAASIVWQQVVGEASTSPTRRRLVSLGCQLGLLALVITALVEPTFSERGAARRIVLIVDTSASMKSGVGEASAMVEAKRRAADRIDALGRHDKMAILSAGSLVRRHIGFSDHRRSLHSALAGVAIEDIAIDGGSGRVSEAVRLARRMIDDGGGRIVVLSDAAFDGAAKLAAADDVELISLGGPLGNLAITRFALRENFLRAGRAEVFVEVTNHSGEAIETTLLISRDGQEEKTLPVRVAARERWSDTIDLTTAEGGLLRATLDHNDAVAEDNVAELNVPASRPLRVALVTKGNPALQRALQAIAKVQFTVVDDVARVADDVDVTVLDAVVPATLPAGPLLMINPVGESRLWGLGEAVEEAVVPVVRNPVVRDASDLMHRVRLDETYLSASRRIVPRGDADVLAASAAGDPLYLRFKRPGGDVLLLAADAGKGDLRLHETFPLLLAGAVDSLGGRTTDATVTAADIPPNDRDRWAAVVPTQATDATGGSPWWPAYAAIVLVWMLLLVEWQAFHQRWIM